jgi:CDP-glycerol glycerophosphotransferase (TagB/SpsB family)
VIDRLKAKGTICSEEDENFYRGRAQNREKLFNEFIEMIGRIGAELGSYNIVVRPHPSEKISLWKDSLSNLERVYVIREGSALPWIIGSEVMIHNDCTTAIEASLLERPVIAFRPTAGNPYESELAVSVGKSAFKVDELLQEIRSTLKKEDIDWCEIHKNNKHILGQYIQSINNGLACDTIVNLLDLLWGNERTSSTGFMLRTRQAVRRLRYRYDNYKKSKKGRKYEALTKSNIEDIIKGLDLHSHLFSDLIVKKIRGTQTCYRIIKQ